MNEGNKTVQKENVHQRNCWCFCSGPLLSEEENCCCRAGPVAVSTDVSDPSCVTATNEFAALINTVVLETVSPPQNQLGEKRPAEPNVQLHTVRKMWFQHITVWRITVCKSLSSSGNSCKLHSVNLVILSLHFGNLQKWTILFHLISYYFSSMNRCWAITAS